MHKEGEETSFSSNGNDEEEKPTRIQAVREYQITQVATKSCTSVSLDLITLTREAKRGKVRLLLDTNAAITFLKVDNLKGETWMLPERLMLTGVTGHTIHTLGKIKATIKLRGREVRYTIYVMKDDFPIEYERILGIDFLKKQKTKCDHEKDQVRIGKTILPLQNIKRLR